jgi:signal transduction histidine kinase
VNNSSNMNTTSSIGKSSKINSSVPSQIFILGPRIGFTILLLLLAIFIWGQYQSTKSGDSVLHTVTVQAELTKLLSNLQDAETGQRGYLLTYNIEYLEPYILSSTNFFNTRNKLRALIKDNPIQQKNIDRIEALVHKKLNELKQTILLTRNGEHKKALEIVKSNDGKYTMDKIRIIVADMKKIETNLLEQKQEEFNMLRNLVWAAGIFTFVSLFILAILVNRQINNSFKQLNDNEKILRELNKDLQLSNQELEKFAYIASHDLKAPLRGIKNLADWIEEDLNETLQEETKENMGLLHSRIDRLDILLDDILTYSRIGHSNEDQSTIVNSKLMIEDIASLLGGENFDLIIKTDDSLPIFKTIKFPLEQVFRNLISNAIKHHDRTSINIEITAEENAEYIKFSVKDDGPGIAPKYHELIFEMFKTLKPRDDVEGSGIGLAIIKKLVSIHGGTIHVESQSGIRGTNFIFEWKKSGDLNA